MALTFAQTHYDDNHPATPCFSFVASNEEAETWLAKIAARDNAVTLQDHHVIAEFRGGHTEYWIAAE